MTEALLVIVNIFLVFIAYGVWRLVFDYKNLTTEQIDLSKKIQERLRKIEIGTYGGLRDDPSLKD